MCKNVSPHFPQDPHLHPFYIYNIISYWVWENWKIMPNKQLLDVSLLDLQEKADPFDPWSQKSHDPHFTRNLERQSIRQGAVLVHAASWPLSG